MIIADTGFFFALANPRDRYHQPAVRALTALKDPLITTYPVITETCYLLLSTNGNAAQRNFLSNVVAGATDIFQLKTIHLMRMVTLIEIYADLPMDMADASLVVLAEHLGHGRILSSDRRDFQVYRWNQTQPFENLLLNYL
ncbi:type II toxin-antitoxin system VapC family toxin [Alkalinema pantanalense CENA528]|uniref:type II toxin-antitoxin system VapC family toxin n=1 Tax=Alkalinema pantanalense TaxID=1620705 RepID=UPI003D6F3105